MMLDELNSKGFVKLSLEGNAIQAQRDIIEILRPFARPAHVFLRHPFWKPIGVDPNRPPGRSEGVGLNSLHIDCVSSKRPPRYMAMLCVTPDAGGGGATLLSDPRNILELLTSETRRVLSSLRIPAEPTYDLAEVGPGLLEYRIDSDDGEFFRYSGRYLDDYQLADHERTALLELDRVLMVKSQVVKLGQLDAVVIDQRAALHGRLPLSRAGTSRLLTQAFFTPNGND